MEPIFDTYENMILDQAAIEILESMPKDFWKPSQEAQDQVRQEFVDKITTPPKTLQQFHRHLGQEIRERVLATARQVDDWKKQGQYQWNAGDHVYSATTGKTYEITGHSVGGPSKNRYATYTYSHRNGEERGTFIAAKAHESLKKVS